MLFVAAALFAVAGVLGILSIGVLFFIVAVGSAAAGLRVGRDDSQPVNA